MYFSRRVSQLQRTVVWHRMAGCDVSVLTVGNFLIKNLLPVTLGNILGGGLFVGMVYWFTGRKLK